MSDSSRVGSNLDRLSEVEWTFKDSDTNALTHNIHRYPAMMVPQLPRTLLNHLLNEGILDRGDEVYDPFGGSGTTALEANRLGLNATLVDLNPLACMIARAKTTPLEIDKVREAGDALYHGNLPAFDWDLSFRFAQIRKDFEEENTEHLIRPEVSDRFEWFPKPQLYQLGHLRERIDTVENQYNEDIARFFRVCLSTTARKVSYQRLHEFKRYRIPEEEWESHNPSVLDHFSDEVSANLDRIEQLSGALPEDVRTRVLQDDSRRPPEGGDYSADVVITSPPYGDHDTTVAYGQFSLDQAVISMGVDRNEMKMVDKEGLGGNSSPIEPLSSLRSKSDALNTTLQKLTNTDIGERSTDALRFFNDYYECIKSINYVLDKGQLAVIVVSNRQMSRVEIPTDQITIDLFSYLGFNYSQRYHRKIPNKIMPHKNAPENESGNKSSTMEDEHILVFQK